MWPISYLDRLELLLPHQLQEDTEVTGLFQQDGAPWQSPATRFEQRSPDRTPLNFHFNFWGYVKENVCLPPLPQSWRNMRDRIRGATVGFDEDVLSSLWEETAFRRDMRLTTPGRHMEHTSTKTSVFGHYCAVIRFPIYEVGEKVMSLKLNYNLWSH